MFRRCMYLAALLALVVTPLKAQTDQLGRVVVDSLYSEYLVNPMGEDPTRALSVYLPPGYDRENRRYPVIYYLHGFMNNHVIRPEMKAVLDSAILKRKVRPFILVVSDQRTSYDGSFYSNSDLYGRWEDFTALDLVAYTDTHYRTLADPQSRGITGHSMGGYGALKIAMHHPEIFSSVYALSPGALAIVREYGPNSNTYQELASVQTEEALQNTYFAKVIVAFGKSWSPNPDRPPFYCDTPFEFKDGELYTYSEVLAKWQAEMPVHMIEANLENLRSLTAIKLDWGRNAGERFTQQCKMFSQRLENAGITHFAEEYIGTHVSGIFTHDGRVPNAMLPFFDSYLDFGD